MDISYNQMGLLSRALLHDQRMNVGMTMGNLLDHGDAKNQSMHDAFKVEYII